nr:MAG: replication associated protein [Cressdnaviricota sp.]
MFQLEQGADGTPHFQGYCDFGRKVRPCSVVKYTNRVTWGKIDMKKGGIKGMIAYCSKKDETYRAGPWWLGIEEPITFILAKLRPFQEDLMKIIIEKPNDRQVVWVVDPLGCAGKTAFAKHVCSIMPNEALYVCGKGADVKYAVSEHLENHSIRVVFFDFTRDTEGYVSYSAIESIKNGIFFNTKYESRMRIFASPHVIVFSNFEPDVTKLSADRWVIIRPAPLEPVLPVLAQGEPPLPQPGEAAVTLGGGELYVNAMDNIMDI